MLISRRGILGGLASMLAAPAIVHAGNLMPVKSVTWTRVCDWVSADSLPLPPYDEWERMLAEWRSGDCHWVACQSHSSTSSKSEDGKS
jgi:hypothetical protein